MCDTAQEQVLNTRFRWGQFDVHSLSTLINDLSWLLLLATLSHCT